MLTIKTYFVYEPLFLFVADASASCTSQFAETIALKGKNWITIFLDHEVHPFTLNSEEWTSKHMNLLKQLVHKTQLIHSNFHRSNYSM